MKKDKGPGKFTFHFDDKGNRIGESMEYDEDRRHVIPLTPDEYSVEEDSARRMGERDAFTPWGSESEEEMEADRVERLIRESDAEPLKARHNEQEIVRPEWQPIWEERPARPSADETSSIDSDDRKADDGEWNWANDPQLVMDSLQMNYRKHPPTNWWKAALSVTTAIVTGVALGLFALHMLQQDDAASSGTAGEPTISVSKATGMDGATAMAGDKQAIAGSPSAGGTAALGGTGIEARSYVLLQNGVFNTASASEGAITALKNKGVAAAVESGEPRTVYAGFAASRDDAQRLSKLLKDKKVDIYAKTITLPAMNRIKWTGTKPNSVAEYIRNGDKLVRMMSGVAIGHLEEAQPTPFDQATVKAIKDAHKLWAASAGDLLDGGKQAAAVVQSMTKAMGDAVAAFDSYGAKPSAALLWEAQSAMMRYVIAQKQLQSLIGA